MPNPRGNIPLPVILTRKSDYKPTDNYHEDFKYDNLASSVYRHYGLNFIDPTNNDFQYIAFSKYYSPTVFYWIKKIGYSSVVNNGDKFHISLAHIDSNVAQGWNLVKDILIRHKVVFFKVISYKWSFKTRRRIGRCGKEITIYAFYENRELADWQNILTEITESLVSNSIFPGPLAPNETPINGSNYISFRNDKIEIDREDTPSEEDIINDSEDEMEDCKDDNVANTTHQLNVPTQDDKEENTTNEVDSSDQDSKEHDQHDKEDSFSKIGISVDVSEGESNSEEHVNIPYAHPFKSIRVSLTSTQPVRPIFIKPARIPLPPKFFEEEDDGAMEVEVVDNTLAVEAEISIVETVSTRINTPRRTDILPSNRDNFNNIEATSTSVEVGQTAPPPTFVDATNPDTQVRNNILNPASEPNPYGLFSSSQENKSSANDVSYNQSQQIEETRCCRCSIN